MLRVNLKCQRSVANAGSELEKGRFMFLGTTRSEDWIPSCVIIGCWRRVLVALDEDWVWVILRRSVGMMYGACFVRCGCAVEAKSTSQQRTAKNSYIGGYLGSRKAGKN